MRTFSSSRLGLRVGARGVLCTSLALLASSACTGPQLEGVEYDHGPIIDGGHGLTLTVNRDVDVLFVIDDSASMSEEQVALASGMGALVEVLERPEVAANYRIGFTTTDNGNPWCEATTAEGGELQLSSCRSRIDDFYLDGVHVPTVPPDACTPVCPEALAEIEVQPTAIDVGGEQRPRPWVESTAGRTNLPEGVDMVQALQCLAPQGIRGCGFESPLESMWKALRRSQTRDEQAYGFVRRSAILSVVHVTDEDDCSANSAWESIFLAEGDRVFWSDPTAEAPTSALCWNAGVVCEGTDTYECRSIDRDEHADEIESGDPDELAVLRPMSRYVDLLQELEYRKQELTPDQEVLVSLIGGVNADGSVTYRDAMDDPQFQQEFGIGPGCTSSMGRAVPPVRLRELADAFAVGDQRNMFSVCEADYSPALTAIGEAIAEQLKPACMPACVADMDPSTPDVLDPSCTLIQESPQPNGSFEELDVLPCEPGGALPEGQDVCFVALTGDQRSATCADYGFNLEFQIVRREGVPAPDRTSIMAACNLSQTKSTDCPDLY